MTEPRPSGMTTTTTVGIAIGILAFIIICLVLFWCCCHGNQGFKQQMDDEVKDEIKVVHVPTAAPTTSYVPALPAPSCCGCQNRSNMSSFYTELYSLFVAQFHILIFSIHRNCFIA